MLEREPPPSSPSREPVEDKGDGQGKLKGGRWIEENGLMRPRSKRVH
jgi:hypothetical protein